MLKGYLKAPIKTQTSGFILSAFKALPSYRGAFHQCLFKKSLFCCLFMLLISISRCHKFIIHPGGESAHTLPLCPYNPVSMTTGISSIRPGRGMICELRVNSNAPNPAPSVFLFRSLTGAFDGHAPNTHRHNYRDRRVILLCCYFQGHLTAILSLNHYLRISAVPRH